MYSSLNLLCLINQVEIFNFVEQETCVLSSWFEVLCILYTLAVLTLIEANMLLIPKQYAGSSDRIVSTGTCILITI